MVSYIVNKIQIFAIFDAHDGHYIADIMIL